MFLQEDENAHSDFDKALSLLENNFGTTIRYINIPGEQKYPYPAYNTAAEMATVVTVPRDLHEGPAVELGRMITNGAEAYLSSHGADASLSRNIVSCGSTTEKCTSGKYVNSKKQADGTIKYKSVGASGNVMIAIEVGYIENYKALLRDKDLWIEGRHVKVCIVVCLKESPPFRNPPYPL
ncbi:hypothetical protein V1506DRAFT_542219 [Lipomyces tetrasporus]